VRWALLDLVLEQQPANMELRKVDGTSFFRVLETSSLTASDLDGDFVQKLGLQPYQPPIYPIIDKLTKGGAAQQAGLLSQDEILTVNGQAIYLWDDLVSVVRSHPGSLLTVEIRRAGNVQTLSIIPEAITEGGKQIGRIGAAPLLDHAAFEALLTKVHYLPWPALKEAVRKTWETSAVSVKMIWKMVLGEVSLKNLSGPISIANYAGQSAQMGLGPYLDFLALISISLGVLNLLPIPLLDGGHLLYYTVELIKGSPVSEKIWDAGQNIGIALLATMMVFALYNDISRLF
jgi:regulator of sigma E protease